MPPTQRFVSALSEHNCDPKPDANGWSARCPAHEDRRPSLSVSEGDDGRALVRCHAGCEFEQICEAVGLQPSDLMPAPNPSRTLSKPNKNDKSRIVAMYDYRDEDGNLLLQVVRYDPKDFRQRRLKPGGKWSSNVKGVRVVPYRLPELNAEPERPIVIAEGEKDCDNLARIGVLATCNAGGARKWTSEHSAFLRGRHVIVLADNDDAGHSHAQQVAQNLYGVAESVRVVQLPGLPPKGDVSDWIEAGGTEEELKQLAKGIRVWTPDSQPWPEIISFDALELPDFPTDALPRVLRQWVEAESHATQTPTDLAALLVLSVCSARIAGRLVIEARPGWQEPVNLFTAVLLEPGNRKSAVFKEATKPLRDLEAELIEDAGTQIACEESERRQSEARLRNLEKIAAEKQGDEAEEARQAACCLATELAKCAEPVLPRLIVDDATAEKLVIMLAEQDGRIASMSPEGGVFDLMAGKYSKSNIPEFGVYLMGHSGDNLITDRVGRESVRVERPALTCAYAIQPSVIKTIGENAVFRGRGLLARFLYAAPQSLIGRREIAPDPVPSNTREAYCQAVRAMAEVENDTVLQLSDSASNLFYDWEFEIETMLADGGQLEGMRDWGAKLAGATLRLAAVLHCMERNPTRYVEAQTIAASMKIGRYLIPHAEAVLNMMSAGDESSNDDACYVLQWIKRYCRRDFTKRDVHQHGKQRFPKSSDIDPALEELTRRGYIRLRPITTDGPGRRPSPMFDVNPKAFDDVKP